MQFLHLCKYPFKVKPSVMRFQSSVDNDRCSLKPWSALNHENSIFLIADTDMIFHGQFLKIEDMDTGAYGSGRFFI